MDSLNVFVVLFEEYENDSVYGAANGTEIHGPYLYQSKEDADEWVSHWLREWLSKQFPYNIHPKHRERLCEKYNLDAADIQTSIREKATDAQIKEIIAEYFDSDMNLGQKTLIWRVDEKTIF